MIYMYLFYLIPVIANIIGVIGISFVLYSLYIYVMFYEYDIDIELIDKSVKDNILTILEEKYNMVISLH